MGGSLAGFMDMADDLLFQCRESDEGCLMALYPSSIDVGTYWIGPAWITRMNINVNTGGAAAIDAAWSAAGAWTRHSGAPGAMTARRSGGEIESDRGR
jgi:hypothetical protein